MFLPFAPSHLKLVLFAVKRGYLDLPLVSKSTVFGSILKIFAEQNEDVRKNSRKWNTRNALPVGDG